MENLEKFLRWNETLFTHFFCQPTDDEEVSLYIDKDKIEEIGTNNGLDGFNGFISLITLSVEERQQMYTELRNLFLGTNMSPEQRRLCRSNNLFDFARIFIDSNLYPHIKCPFLIYIVFAVLVGSECVKNQKAGIRNNLTKFLRYYFPNHSSNIASLEVLFNELSRIHPRFVARKLTRHPYVGLIRYQLGLSNAQANRLKKALFNADLSEVLPYEQQVEILKDYLDAFMRALLRRSLRDIVIKRRISDLIESFDPLLYEQTHPGEEITSKGHFVLAIYEDDYSENNDRLVLLTDINNRSLTGNQLRIEKGTMDRLGKYAQYNVNHVLINNSDIAEMRTYRLDDEDNHVRSVSLDDIVLFSRSGHNYLIQNDFPYKGEDTYILVRCSDQEFQEWLVSQGNPCIKRVDDVSYVRRIFGEGWDMYISTDIENVVVHRRVANNDLTISMNGGINCPGRYNVYLFNALPYFEFPEPINEDKLRIYICVDNNVLEDDEYIYKIINNNRLVIDLMSTVIGDYSSEIDIALEYKTENNKKLLFHEDFAVIGQKVTYSENDLFKMNMWGSINTDENAPYLKGLKVYNARKQNVMPKGTGFYQNTCVDIDINDRRFYLVNLFTAECSMREGFSITESRLKKCIRYAATRFDINIASEPTFYTDVKYMLLNSGYMNADFEHGKYQPVPPTFLKTALGISPGRNLFMLVGAYTQKFLSDLKMYCNDRHVPIYLHTINNGPSKSEELIPPVILLGDNFNPNDFAENTDTQCSYFDNEDFAITLLKALPSYADYDSTLNFVSPNVFNTPLETPDSDNFPRIRVSRRTGYGSSMWIEKNENVFHQITIPDIAWANLYCQYNKQSIICTKDIDKLLFSAKLHLPIMMQRALYILNFGVPQKEKAFICNNDDRKDVYFNVVKRYKINDTNTLTRISPVIHAITGHSDNEQNTSVRHRVTSKFNKLYIWKNKTRSLKNPRSLLVLTDIYGEQIFGIAIKRNKASFSVYLREGSNNNRFSLVDNEDVNFVFSKIITSNWDVNRLNYNSITDSIGVRVIENQYLQLPPKEEYDIEEIQII